MKLYKIVKPFQGSIWEVGFVVTAGAHCSVSQHHRRQRAPPTATPRCWPRWRATDAVQDRPLVEAFIGRFSDHHRFLLTTMLARVDALRADIAAVGSGPKNSWALSRRRWPAWMRSPGLDPPPQR